MFSWAVVLLMHLVAAAGWWWAMPGGFPVGHERFLANRMFPIVIGAMALVGLLALLRRHRAAGIVLLAIAVIWVSAAVTGRIIFPISARRFWLAGLLIGGLFAWRAMPFVLARPVSWRIGGVIIFLATMLGAALPWSQRGGEPMTVPFAPRPRPPVVVEQSNRFGGTRLDDTTMFWPASGSISTRLGGGVSLELFPMLRFISMSPDRCWTSLAPTHRREDHAWRMIGTVNDGNAHRFFFRGMYFSDLRIVPWNSAGRLSVTAQAWLNEPIYSHLNSYCEIALDGHRRISLAFSPCPDVRIEVEPSDYPVGRPRRLAYLGDDGVFRVVEATSAEKGPFRELASGRLERRAPLSIIVYDADEEVGVVTLDDFAGHASTALSPTAGWGLPQNAIEFSRASEAPESPVHVWITLAGTSIGRGWDSVGHTAGFYRNRVTVERR